MERRTTTMMGGEVRHVHSFFIYYYCCRVREVEVCIEILLLLSFPLYFLTCLFRIISFLPRAFIQFVPSEPRRGMRGGRRGRKKDVCWDQGRDTGYKITLLISSFLVDVLGFHL